MLVITVVFIAFSFLLGASVTLFVVSLDEGRNLHVAYICV